MDKKQNNFIILIFILFTIAFWVSTFLFKSTFQGFFGLGIASFLLIFVGLQLSDKLKKFIYFTFLLSIFLLLIFWVFKYSIYLPDYTIFLGNLQYGLVFWSIFSGILSFQHFLPLKQDFKLSSKFWLLIVAIFLIGIFLRLRNLGNLGFVNDEGYTALYSYLINQSGLPCDFNTGICYLRGLPYQYFVAIFTYFLGVNEFSVRLPNILIFVGILVYLYRFLCLLKFDKYVIVLVLALLSVSDFVLVLTDLARFYTMGLFWFLMFLYYYYRGFILHQKTNYFLLGLSAVLGIFTFEFNSVFLYFLLDPLLTSKFKLYKNPKFLIICILIILSMITINIRSVYLYLDSSYLGYADISPFPTIFAINKIGFNLFYIDLLIRYLPFVFVFGIIGLFFILKNQHKHKTFLYFTLFCLFAFVFYKSQGFVRYARGFYSILFIFFAYGFCMADINRYFKYLFVFIIFAVNLGNIYYIKTLSYGAKTDKNLFLSVLPIEKYYPDDKSFIDYLNKNYQNGDVIIFDYRIQEVYLKLSKFPQPDYVITPFGPVDYLKAYSNIKIYKNGNDYSLYKNGTKFIKNREDLFNIISQNSGKKIFYISSADFSGQKNHSISNKNLYEYITLFYKPVFVGHDGNTKIFDLSQ